jgi:hypothetical protein
VDCKYWIWLGNSLKVDVHVPRLSFTFETNRANTGLQARASELEGYCLPPDHYTSFSHSKAHLESVAKL